MIMAFFPVVTALIVGIVSTAFSWGVAWALHGLLHFMMGVK